MRIVQHVLARRVESLTNDEWTGVIQPWSQKISKRFKEKTLGGTKLGDFPCLHIGSSAASIHLRHASQCGRYQVRSVKGITLDSRGLFGQQAKNYNHSKKWFWGFLHSGVWVLVEVDHFDEEYDPKKFNGYRIEPPPRVQIAREVRIQRVELEDLIEMYASPVGILDVFREAIERKADEHRSLSESLQGDEKDLEHEIETLRSLDKNYYG